MNQKVCRARLVVGMKTSQCFKKGMEWGNHEVSLCIREI